MRIINHPVKNILKLCIASVTTSLQPALSKTLRLASLAVLISCGPAVFAATAINGVINGNTSETRAEDARYERIYALWGALATAAGEETELPRWSAREVLAFTTGVHLGRQREFSERTLLEILTVFGETPFDVSSIGDPVFRKQVLHAFEDASLLFYSLQENYQNAGNLSELRLPGNLGRADLFFAKALYQDIRMPQKSSFAKDNQVKWQELVITGLWYKADIVEGRAGEEALKNHALVQSILWVGRELIETVKDDDDWTGPAAADFELDSFKDDFKVARFSPEDLTVNASSSQDNAEDYLSEVELSLYWAIKGILFYESKRLPLYDRSTGASLSVPSAEALIAQCFNRVYDSYQEALTPTFSVFFEVNGVNMKNITDKRGTRVSRWLEARTIDPTPLVSDRSALDFLYSNLPGTGGNDRGLISVLQSIQGASTVVTIARYWASSDDVINHPDYRSIVNTSVRVNSAYNAANTELRNRGRPGRIQGTTWIYRNKETALDEIEKEIREGRRAFFKMLALDAFGFVLLPVAAEYFAVLEAAPVSAADLQLLEDMRVAGEFRDAARFWSIYDKFSSSMQYRLASQARLYKSVLRVGAFGANLASVALASSSSGYSVSIAENDVTIEVPFISVEYGSVSLFEYFASVRLALDALDAYYAAEGGSVAAAQVLSDYARSADVDLGRVSTVYTLLPLNARINIETAVSGATDALETELHSGNMEAVVDYLFALEPGRRWPVLKQSYEAYGLNLAVALLASIVDRSEETAAGILMEYQRSTLPAADSAPADSAIPELFLGLGTIYPDSNYQQKIIAACESLELCGDFLLDIGVWTGEGDYNAEGVADALEDVQSLRAGQLLGEMYELEQERAMPGGSLVEEVVYIWLKETGFVRADEVYATTLYIMTTGQITLQINTGNNTMLTNATKVNEYLGDPIRFIEDGGEQLLSGGGGGGGDDNGNDSLYRTMGRHVMSKGLDYWVAFIAEQLALARDLEDSHEDIVSIVGATSLGTNDTDFMADTVRGLGANADALAQLILGILSNADLFPDNNWAWLRSWFKYTPPHTLGEALDEAYGLNNTPDFESRATQNREDLDAITAVFLENMEANDAAARLAAMSAERAKRILALMQDEETIGAILEAMATSDDAAIRGAFTTIMDAADDPNQRENLFIILMRNRPQVAWQMMNENNGNEFNYYLAIILSNPFDDPNQTAQAFARMLSSADPAQAATALRNLILQGDGEFVGLVLGYMGRNNLNGNFLDQLFSPILQDSNIDIEVRMNRITQVIRSLLSQTLLGDDSINFRTRAILFYLSTIPDPNGNNNSVWVLPAFRTILRSDLRSYFVNHMIDMYIEADHLDDLESLLASAVGSSRVNSMNVLNALLRRSYTFTHDATEGDLASFEGVNLYELSDSELLDFTPFQNDPLLMTRFLFTRFVFIDQYAYFGDGAEEYTFNPSLERDRIFRLIGLFIQRIEQETDVERQRILERWLGLVLMPVAEQAMAMNQIMTDNDILLPANFTQGRLGDIFSHFLADNQSDVVIRIINSMLASVTDSRHAYFMLERAILSMNRQDTGTILALLIAQNNMNLSNLVIRVLNQLGETQGNEAVASVLGHMIAVLNQNDVIGLQFMYNYIRQYIYTNDIGSLVVNRGIRHPFADIFTRLSTDGQTFSWWIMTMLNPTSPANSDGSLTREIARIFNSMILNGRDHGTTNEGVTAIVRFISAVLAPQSNYTEAQRSLLGSLLNEMVRSQAQDEVQDLFTSLLTDTTSAGYGNYLLNAMMSEVDGAGNVYAILQSVSAGATTGGVIPLQADQLARMNPHNAAAFFVNSSPADAAQVVAQMITDGNIDAISQIIESTLNPSSVYTPILLTLSPAAARQVLSHIDPTLAADIFAEMVGGNQVDRAAEILLGMDIQAATTLLVLIIDSYPELFPPLRDSMARQDSNRYDVISQALGSYTDRFGSARRDTLLSYSAINDRDGDYYWEPRDDQGALITDTDHHLLHSQGVRRLQTSHLNYAYYFDGTGGSSMASLEALAVDPTKGSATFELWLRPGSLPAGDVHRMLFESGGGQTGGIALTLREDSVAFSLSKSLGIYGFHNLSAAVFNRALPTDALTHVVGVIEHTGSSNRSSLHLYINGELADSSEYSHELSLYLIQLIQAEDPSWRYEPTDWADATGSGLGSVHGAEQRRYFENFEGWISEFHFYSRALSAEDIASLYRLRPAAPENVLISTIKESGRQTKYFLELSWPEVPEVSGYNIYRTDRDVPVPARDDLIASIDGGGVTTYRDEEVDSGTIYYYWITSHNYWEESNFSESTPAVPNPKADAENTIDYAELASINAARAQSMIGQLYNRSTGAQAGYIGPAEDPLVKYGRVWAYDAGISLSLAVRGGGAGDTHGRANWLRENARYNDEGLFLGWPFSMNQQELGDAWEDPRFVTGANAWALKSIAEYVAEGGGGSEYRELFSSGLTGILYHRKSNDLFGAGFSPAGLDNPAQFGVSYNLLLSAMGDWMQIKQREYRLLNGIDALIPGVSITNFIKDQFDRLFDAVGFELDDLHMLLEGKTHVVTEHCIDVLALLNYTLEHYYRLSPAHYSYDELDSIRKRLRSSIFENLYVNERFVTGEGATVTAIDNTTWLCSALNREELLGEDRKYGPMRQKLASSMKYTVDNFVKHIEMRQNLSYWGAHYFPNEFEDTYIEQSDDQESAYHIEATAGLIIALNDYADSFPNNKYSDYFRKVAVLLWQEMQLYVNRYGLLYSSLEIQDLFVTYECTVSSVWFLKTYQYYQEHPEFYGLVDDAEDVFASNPDGNQSPGSGTGSSQGSSGGRGSGSSSASGERESSSSASGGRENTAAMILIAESPEPEVLVLTDYDGNGLAGVDITPRGEETSYLVQDETGDTARAFVAGLDELNGPDGPEPYQIKRFDVAEDVSHYDQLAFDYYSTVYDERRSIQIQLRFANKENPGARNFWNWKSPVPLSEACGDWTRVSVGLSATNFQPGVEWQPGNDFNLDRLEGIAVLILAEEAEEAESVIYLDNIELLVNERE